MPSTQRLGQRQASSSSVAPTPLARAELAAGRRAGRPRRPSPTVATPAQRAAQRDARLGEQMAAHERIARTRQSHSPRSSGRETGGRLAEPSRRRTAASPGPRAVARQRARRRRRSRAPRRSRPAARAPCRRRPARRRARRPARRARPRNAASQRSSGSGSDSDSSAQAGSAPIAARSLRLTASAWWPIERGGAPGRKCRPSTSVSVAATSAGPGGTSSSAASSPTPSNTSRARATRGGNTARSGRIRRAARRRRLRRERLAACSADRSAARRAVEHGIDELVAVGGAEALGELDALVDHDAIRNVGAAAASSWIPISSTACSTGSSCATGRSTSSRARRRALARLR